jgi:hypothetical protein
MVDVVIQLLLILAHLSSLHASQEQDWLVNRITTPSYVNDQACWDYGGKLCGIEISNKILTRRFVLTKDNALGSIDFLLNATSSRGGLVSMFRAVTPEATISVGGVEYAVGGLNETRGDGFRAYRNVTGFASRLGAAASNTTFRYKAHRISTPVAPFPWEPGHRHGLLDVSWPPKGVTLAIEFTCDLLPDLLVTLFYEIYDGIPLMSKWMTVSSVADPGSNDVLLDSVAVELLAANARFGAYLDHGSLRPGSDDGGATQAGVSSPFPLLHVKTDQAHGAGCEWIDDFPNSHDVIPGCPTCKDEGAVEPLLRCSYTIGPGAHVSSNESFASFRTLLLATDSTNLERQTLSRHRVTQILAPHVTENPIFFHATNVTQAGFQHAIDQMAEVVF